MKKILLLPGDGIGPEVMSEVVRVIDALSARGFNASLDVRDIGGASIDQFGVPVTDDVLNDAGNADVILLGAVGGPKWSSIDYARRPEQGLLTLRKEMGLYANIRPALCFPALERASSLKPELVSGLDIVIVRELIGGVYFGEPRGIESVGAGERRGVNTQVYASSEIRRVAQTAFQLAESRQGRLCSVDKANVMESGLLWREEVTALHRERYQHIELQHMYADNCAMQLVKQPKQFDVILTDNLFGDILSDEAAMLTGSLGMLPSASLGQEGAPGLYEPIHGSAPDIAGKGVANPCAAVLSLSMALRLQLDQAELGKRLETAVAAALEDGYRTLDLVAEDNAKRVGAKQMADAIIERLDG